MPVGGGLGVLDSKEVIINLNKQYAYEEIYSTINSAGAMLRLAED